MSVPESLLSKDKILHDYWYSSSESEESGDEIMDCEFYLKFLFKNIYCLPLK